MSATENLSPATNLFFDSCSLNFLWNRATRPRSINAGRLSDLRAAIRLARLWREQSKRQQAHDLLADWGAGRGYSRLHGVAAVCRDAETRDELSSDFIRRRSGPIGSSAHCGERLWPALHPVIRPTNSRP